MEARVSEQIDPAGGAGKKAGAMTIAAAVFWSFLGVRKRKDYERDTVSISLKQVIVAGIIGGVLFVCGVIALVKIILANAGAAA